MKGIVNFLSLFIVGLAIGLPISATAENLPAYVVADFKYLPMHGYGEWASYLPNSYPVAVLGLGIIIDSNLGVELGYEGTTTRAQSLTINPPTTFFNSALTGTTTIQSNLTFQNWYLDFFAYAPIIKGVKLFATAGLNYAKPSLRVRQTVNNGTANLITASQLQAKALWRGGFGAEYTSDNNWGLRTMVRWENYDRLRFSQQTVDNIQGTVPGYYYGPIFNNTYSTSLGVFYSF